jgi:hypothetical protein
MSHSSIFPENCKFAVLAAQNVRTDIRSELTIRPGTIAVKKLPFPLENHWRLWLGAMQASNLENCNLFLVSIRASGWRDGQLAVFGGDLDSELMDHIGGIFAFLRIVGPIEYTDAFLVAGHVEDGRLDLRHFARTERFNISCGSLPWVVRDPDLQEAAQLSEAYRSLLKRLPGQRWRFARGCHALKTAMEQHYASDRLHGFVRALEGLIIPDTGKTKKQFISRCALFAGPAALQAKVREILQEAYKMRCDVEHVHDWDRSLANYPPDEREHIAYWRTRQMEELACAIYRRIISDPVLQANFHDDSKLRSFWQRPDADLRAVFGDVCDITRSLLFKKYDSYGRAHPSEWPKGVFEALALVKSA